MKRSTKGGFRYNVSSLFFGTVGAPVSGLVKDVTGSYFPTWTVALFLLVVATALMLMTRKPTPGVD